jgi:phosphatidylserine/phosphatidylglycerophosphate/cardiolipin synthase-like enzyme
MQIAIAGYANCDDAVVFWAIDRPIRDCLGFAIERQTGRAAKVHVVENRIGFTDAPGRSGERRPSTTWPFQRFSWSDHQMDLGDRARYRVVPMLRDARGDLRRADAAASKWTPWLALAPAAGGMSAWFNRGHVISQFMARHLARLRRKEGLTHSQALAAFKTRLSDHEEPIRLFLSGGLRTRLLDLLAATRKAGGHVYAALYELTDDELIGALAQFKSRAHVVLANGSVKKKGEDGNKSARKVLKAGKVDVRNRMSAPRFLAHNKFLVTTDKQRKPKLVWTGSTNWTKTGLCTQINNGLLIENAKVAKTFAAQWDLLAAAGDGHEDLLAHNDEPKLVTPRCEVRFTRTSEQRDLDAIRGALERAREGVLFLMFMPGPSGTFRDIMQLRAKRPQLYVHGVASEVPRGKAEDEEVDVTLVGANAPLRRRLAVVQPEGIKTPFAAFAATVVRGAFKSQIGHAIIHSKFLVIDPFTDPVVITGSHNFSKAASAKNDENLVFIRGDRELALAYAIHALSVYHHYRWLFYVRDRQLQGEAPWSGLSREPDWQHSHLKPGSRSRNEMEFWVR